MATGGCTSNAVFVVNPAPGLPAAPTTTIGQPTCTAATGTITVTNPVGATYSYSIDGINFQSSPVFNGLAPNSYTVTVMAAGGCTSSGSALVNAVPGFTLNLNASPNPVGQGSILSLTTSSVSAYQVIAWLPTSVFPDQVAMTQSIVATTNTTYVAVGKSPDGCIDSAQVTITVTPGKNDVFVPNVFTPNNDGKNDKLFVYGNLIREIDFKIFNQWGELVFQTIDKNIGWDGRYKGSMQPVTVYIYVLKATMQDGSIITKKGSVTLVR
jgi:gliding motility-associated-like protein